MSADAFVLANIRNAPSFPTRMPTELVDRVLATGRAIVFVEAWVDVCAFDMPCFGDPAKCLPGCDRSYADSLYRRARVAGFNSPRQCEAIRSVIGVPLPARTILSRPAIDTAKFYDMGLERDIDVLYVGTISEAKGYRNLLDRFGADRITFAGPNALGEDVQGAYLGPVPYDQVALLMNRARVFAHLPQWLEPMGRTPVEAGLCGCEVVLNDRVGVASYPQEDWTDPETIDQAADRFWNDLEAAYA